MGLAPGVAGIGLGLPLSAQQQPHAAAHAAASMQQLQAVAAAQQMGDAGVYLCLVCSVCDCACLHVCA